MSVVGFQDFWVVGNRLYFKRNAIAGDTQPFIDLGVLQSVSPAFTIEKLELEDTDGGVKRTVDEALTKIDETYDITCSNLNPDNLALVFLSNPVAAFTQSSAQKLAVPHTAHQGRLLKIVDSDSDVTKLYSVQIAGVGASNWVPDTAVTDLITIDASAGTLSFTTDPGILATEYFLLMATGLDDPLNAGAYECASISGAGPYIVTLTGASAAQLSTAETGITGTTTFPTTSGDLYLKGVDYEVVSNDRGFMRMVDGGAFTAGDGGASVVVYFDTVAITGARSLTPQSASEVKGEGVMIWSRGNNAGQTMREIPNLSLTPTSLDLNADDFSSFVIQAKVLADTTLGESAGRMLYFKGDLPSLS
jgi:hypothetical protein